MIKTYLIHIASYFLILPIIYDIRKDESSSEYLVDHSRQAYLFGPEGEPLALLPFDGTPQQVADEITRWVR